MNKKVELVKAKTFEFKPDKNYLLVFENGTLSKEDIEVLVGEITKEFGCKTLGVVLREDIEKMKVVEVPES